MNDPAFDNPRKALVFALNYQLKMPTPVMTQMIADGRVRRIELADGSRVTVADMSRIATKRAEGLSGLDGAATAGFVLQVLASLPEQQQLVLIAECLRPALACVCRAPCCSGHRPNRAWVTAINSICDHLRDEAQLSKTGKKGYSTSPGLRLAIVEKFFVSSRDFVLLRIAERNDVSEQTVVNHRRPILTYLEKQQRAGWRALDEALNSAGIVGTPS